MQRRDKIQGTGVDARGATRPASGLTLCLEPAKSAPMAVPPEISGSLLRSGNLILGRYELIRELGRGGMGVVWLARDRTLQIDLALKFLPDVLRQDRASLDELRDEAVRNLRLTNEHIVRTYDFIEGDGIAGITMEFVDGSTLAGLKVERPQKQLQVAELLPLVRQLCEALHYAHTQPKVVHRDLKPANLMVTKDGRLKVTDFGIARSISDSFSRVSNAQPTSGTLMFMSPQQLMGEPPRPSDDIYSVGATLYDLLTSKPPFFSGSIQAQVLQATPQALRRTAGDASAAGRRDPAAVGGRGASLPRKTTGRATLHCAGGHSPPGIAGDDSGGEVN
jgi:serine/threonine protein kinase